MRSTDTSKRAPRGRPTGVPWRERIEVRLGGKGPMQVCGQVAEARPKVRGEPVFQLR